MPRKLKLATLLLVTAFAGCGVPFDAEFIGKHLCMTLPTDPNIVSSDYEQDELIGDLGYSQKYVLKIAEGTEMQSLLNQIQKNLCDDAGQDQPCGCWNHSGQQFVFQPVIGALGDEIVVYSTLDLETQLLDLNEIRW